MLKLDNKSMCALYGKRATKARYAERYMIEGESVTIAEIAQRRGDDHISAASDRLRALRKNPNVAAITWELLGVQK